MKINVGDIVSVTGKVFRVDGIYNLISWKDGSSSWVCDDYIDDVVNSILALKIGERVIIKTNPLTEGVILAIDGKWAWVKTAEDVRGVFSLEKLERKP